MTDIYGANLYNRYLAQQHTLATHSQVVTQGFGNPVRTGDKELVSSAAECRSILVGLQESSKTDPESQTSMRSMLMGRTTLLDQTASSGWAWQVTPIK